MEQETAPIQAHAGTESLGRVPDGTLGRVPDGTLGRVPDGTLGRVPDGTMGRVPGGTLGGVPEGTTGGEVRRGHRDRNRLNGETRVGDHRDGGYQLGGDAARVATPPDIGAAIGDRRRLLDWIADGDPLGLAARAAERIAERALLMDPRRVLPRVQALVASRLLEQRDLCWSSERSQGIAPTRFVTAQIDRALATQVRADLEAETTRGEFAGPGRFNALDESRRSLFDRVFVGRESLEDLAAERGEDLSSVGRELRAAVDALIPPLSQGSGVGKESRGESESRIEIERPGGR